MMQRQHLAKQRRRRGGGDVVRQRHPLPQPRPQSIPSRMTNTRRSAARARIPRRGRGRGGCLHCCQAAWAGGPSSSGGGNNAAGSALWLRLTEQRGRTGGGRGRRRGATIAAATTEAGIGRGGGGVIVVVVYGGGRSSRTDGDERQGRPMKIHGGAVVGLNAAGACVRPPSRPGCDVLEEGRRPAGQKSREGRRDGGGRGGRQRQRCANQKLCTPIHQRQRPRPRVSETVNRGEGTRDWEARRDGDLCSRRPRRAIPAT
jgi:hypothetical protein